MADARLGVLMTAKNETNAAFTQLKNNIRDTEAAAQGAKGGGFMASLTSQLGGLGGAIAGAGVAFGAMQLATTAIDMAKTAAQVGVLRDSLEGLAATAGTSGDAIVSALQRASGGAIPEQSLILAANRSMLLGVADSAEEMASLMEVAIVRGRAMGLSAEQAFSDLVTGIGRMSPLILDNLGIVTGGEKVFDDYAAALGRTADQLTDVERKQALVNTVISSSASLVAQAGNISQSVSQFDRLTVAVDALKLSLAETFAPSVVAAAGAIADKINDIREADKAYEPALDFSKALWQIDEVKEKIADMQENLAIMRGSAQWVAPGDPGFDGLNAKIKEAESLLRGFQTQLTATYKNTTLPPNSYDAYIADLERAVQSSGNLQNAVTTLSTEEHAAAVAAVTMASNTGYMGSVALSQISPVLQLSDAVAGLQARMAGMSGVFAEFSAMRQGALSQIEAQALEAVRSGASVDAIADMYSEASQEIFDVTLSTEKSTEAYIRNKIAIDQVTQSAGAQIGAVQSALDKNREFAESYGQLSQSAQRAGANIASGLVPSIGVDAALGKSKEFSAELQRNIDLWVSEGKSIDEINGVLYPSLLDQMRESNTLVAAHSSGLGGVAAAVDEVGASYDDLKGTVQGVVSEALNLDVGISPEDFLPREDAVNENARRLAAIMRDGLVGQPWLEEFKAEVPELFAELAASDDPRQAAANMLKQFEAGMRPELIDKGKAKDIVRQMLLGEAATGALVDEIAGELAAELGISIEKAKAAAGASLGVPAATEGEPVSLQIAPPEPVIVPMSYGTPEDAVLPTIEPVVIGFAWGELPEWTAPEMLPTIAIPVSFSTGEGLESSIAAVSASFAAGIELVNAGAKVATQITAQLSGAASLAGFKNAGVSAAGTWGEAFLGRVSEGVPAQLINMLVSLITPEIQAQQQQAATQTGAAI